MIVLQNRVRLLLRGGNETGFTLVEILVVCLLISITLVVAVPTLRDTLLTDQLKAASRKIIGTIRDLRETAVNEHQPYTLYFDLGKNRIWWEKDNEKDRQEKRQRPGDEIQLPAAVRILDIWTKSDGRKSLGTATLWISRQGYMDMTVIHLTDESDTISISFSPFLSSIKVSDGYTNFE